MGTYEWSLFRKELILSNRFETTSIPDMSSSETFNDNQNFIPLMWCRSTATLKHFHNAFKVIHCVAFPNVARKGHESGRWWTWLRLLSLFKSISGSGVLAWNRGTATQDVFSHGAKVTSSHQIFTFLRILLDRMHGFCVRMLSLCVCVCVQECILQ